MYQQQKKKQSLLWGLYYAHSGGLKVIIVNKYEIATFNELYEPLIIQIDFAFNYVYSVQ